MSAIGSIGKYFAIAGLVLAMASGTGLAATITITDLLDGDPVVITNLISAAISYAPEQATIMGYVTPAITNTGFPGFVGTSTVQLLEANTIEPGTTTDSISDIISLTNFEQNTQPNGFPSPPTSTDYQAVLVVFNSDTETPLTVGIP